SGNLATLGYFKYFNFGVDSFNALLGATGGSQLSLWHVILPIGISFYVFQAISYLIDLYREDAPPAARFIDFAAFLSLFPQLIAGPVLRYKDLSEQLAERTHSFELFNEGAQRFMIGFCKKILIADSVAPLVDTVFANPDPTFADAWLGALAYTVQLYFDFSGYSDMAIGLGLMMGFRFIENFNNPYISCSITEFWRRWHISLSTWLRDYLYISMGGNKLGRVRTYVNLFLTMLLGGLWHGANWTFVLWGAWHGALLAIERGLGVRHAKAPYPKWIGFPVTLLFVMIGWVMFRAPDVTTAFGMYSGMIGLHGVALSSEIAWQVAGIEVFMLAVGWVVIYTAPLLKRLPLVPLASEPNQLVPSLAGSLGTVLCMSFAVLKLASDSYSPFLYFQF
ncbi:MAG: MBOAT family protein, partial [Candidatus Competibacteraceae bacterium]|nr:MBOAT family protein [Candidatus Competibacteraceae bacterium]